MTSLVAERVAVEHVTCDRDTATGTVILLRNEVSEKQVTVFPGANAALSLEAINAAAPLLAGARVVLEQHGKKETSSIVQTLVCTMAART